MPHLGRDGEHPPVRPGGTVEGEHAHRGGVAAERLVGERVDDEERKHRSILAAASGSMR